MAALFHGLMQGSRDLIAFIDTDFRFIAINDAYRDRFKTIFGVEPKVGEKLPDTIAHLPEEQRRAVAVWDRTLHGREFTAVQEFGDALTHERHTFEIRSVPIRDDDGRLIGGAHIIRDITAQRQTEESLRASEARFKRLIETTSVGLMLVDSQDSIRYANPAFLEMLGYTWDEISPFRCAQFIAPEYMARHEAAVRQLRAEGAIVPFEKELFGRDGKRVPVIASATLIEQDSGGEPLIAFFITDLTRLKQAEAERERLLSEQTRAAEQLEAEREKLEIILHHMPVGVAVTDAASERRLLINPQAAEILGAPIHPGSRIGEMEHLLCKPDGSPYAYEEYPIIRSLRSGEVVHGEDMLVVRPNGERRTILTHSVPIRTAEGRIHSAVVILNDITQRKKSEEALRQGEERLKMAQRAGHVGVFDWDMATDQAVITGEMVDIFGADPETGRHGYANWIEYVHPDDLERVTAAMQECFNRRQPRFEIEHRIHRTDGQVRWVAVKAQVSYAESGRASRMIGTMVDVTDRKNAENALRESEEKFRALAENARASFGIVQGQRFVYANPWFAKISGYTVDELLTMDFPRLVHPDFVPIMHERARRRQAGENVPNMYEFAMITKSGEKRWVEFSVATIEYRGRPAIIGTGFDITERVRAEADLKLRNERLALLSEAAAHLLKAENPDTMIRELFEKVSRHLNVQGYLNFMLNDAGDALRLDSYAGLTQDAARQVQRLELGQGVCGTVAQNRRPIYAQRIQESDAEIVRPLREFGIRAYACNPLIAAGRLLGTLAFATTSRDAYDEGELEFMRIISWYVAIAKERIRMERELRGHIGQIAAANDALAEADRRKDEFLAMLAHELRNPLAPIRNAMQVLRMLNLKNPGEQRQGNIIDRQITHMARLLDDLLDVSRITRGKIELHLQTLCLTKVVTDAAQAVSSVAEAKHQRLVVIPPPEKLCVNADLDRLSQSIGNLLTNAIKYTDEGGQIWLEAAREDSDAVIRVRDTGVGIPPEMLPRIFDLFTQVDHSLARSQGGLGIGLTLARNLVQMHGGTVEARSDGLGKGSEFTIRIPATAAETPASELPAKAETAAPAGVTHRVLVVDDVIDSAESLAEIVRMWGHDVAMAHDGPGAINKFHEFHPDVILLDIGLPGMDGYEVARHILAEPDARVMLVALTGYGQAEDRHLSEQAGFARHFTKPIDLTVLQDLLEKAA